MRSVSILAVAAGLVVSNLAHAAPWSFDPQRYLVSWTDDERCFGRSVSAVVPEATGSNTVAADTEKARPKRPGMNRSSR
jgi:hypothetical protein